MLLCDTAIREQGTGKYSLIGVFTHIWANRFPAVHAALTIYFCLTDARGSYDLKLRIRNLKTGEELLPEFPPITLQVQDRLSVVEQAIQIRNLKFDEPAKYEVALEANGAPVGSRAFWVGESIKQAEA